MTTPLLILVIEQDPLDQQLLAENLSSQPYFRVLLTGTLEQAALVLAREHIDVVVMNRPARSEQPLGLGSNVPAVMLTEAATHDTPPSHGAYATKPRHPADFAGVVSSIQRLWIRAQLHR